MSLKMIIDEIDRYKHRARRAEILQTAVKKYGYDMQIDICIEEMAELTKALIKMRRNWNEPPAGWTFNKEYIEHQKAIIEEIADVQIMLDQMRIIYGNTAKVEDAKLDRLCIRLERDGLIKY